MGLIPQVKCGRCDRTYSGLRSRCPYCGAHRNKKGKRVTDGDNATWKVIIGVLLIVVLIAAVVVILVTSIGEKNNPPKDDEEQGGDINHGEGLVTSPGQNPENPGGTEDPNNPGTTTDPNNPGTTTDPNNPGGTTDPNNPGTTTDPSGSGTPDTPPEDTPIASSIKVKQPYQNPATDFTLHTNESVECTAIVTPSNVTSPVTWSCSDESVIAVVPTDETGLKAKVTGVGVGTVTVTATVDGISYDFVVYGRK